MDSDYDNLILKILVIANGYCYEFWIYQALDLPGFEVFSSLFSFFVFFGSVRIWTLRIRISKFGY